MDGKFCRNTSEQNAIIDELFSTIEELSSIVVDDALRKKLRNTRLGQLIEFSRSVHAEMDAMLAAGRQGKTLVGTRLFVTTFPCHNCARHIIVAGVDEVQFIEPYLKSKALALHSDAITTTVKSWEPPGRVGFKSPDPRRVLFTPFVGVAPRLFRRAFYKDRDLKDSMSGKMIDPFPLPGSEGVTQVLQQSYAQVEAHLISQIVNNANDS